jgi:DNA polymerase V
VVVSNNDGCVIARSAEAKLGIKWEPWFKIKNNPYYSSVHFSANYALYADLSDRVMQTLTAMSPSIEIYSIDEAFINLIRSKLDLVSLSTFRHEQGLTY